MKYANLIRRILAYLIDSLLVFIVFVVLAQTFFFVPLRSLVIGTDSWFQSGWNTEAYTLLTMSLPTWLYFSLSETSRWQATIGKHALGLKTLSLVSGTGIAFPQAMLRTFIELAPWEIAHLTNNLPVPMWYDPNPGFRLGFIIVPLLACTYLLLALVERNNQSLHDLAARTIVVSNG